MILSVGKKPTDFMQLFHQSLITKETVSKRLSHLMGHQRGSFEMFFSKPSTSAVVLWDYGELN